MNGLPSKGLRCLASALFGMFLLFGLLLYSLQYPLSIPKGETIHYDLPAGTSIKRLSTNLYQEGFIQYEHLFEFLLRLRGKPIQAGEYCLSSQVSLITLVRNLQSGKVCQYPFTLIEGWTVSQISEALNDDPTLIHTLKTPEDIRQAFSRLPFVEGQFLPETYLFPRGTKDVDVLERAHEQLNAVLDSVWNKTKKKKSASAESLLVVASLIEKESAKKDELPLISGIIFKRLENNMRLQIDPSVIYALGDDFTSRLSRDDLRTDSPYNTYRYSGLPPTPIGLAGRAALHAAARPLKTNYLYYVSKGDGSHYFSETLAAHNEAVAKFQKVNK